MSVDHSTPKIKSKIISIINLEVVYNAVKFKSTNIEMNFSEPYCKKYFNFFLFSANLSLIEK